MFKGRLVFFMSTKFIISDNTKGWYVARNMEQFCNTSINTAFVATYKQIFFTFFSYYN